MLVCDLTMTEVTPTKKPKSVTKSPKSGSKRFSFSSSGSKKALAEKNQAPEIDEAQERRNSVAEVTKAREAEQERLVDEGARTYRGRGMHPPVVLHNC